jgi:hypothetical protein
LPFYEICFYLQEKPLNDAKIVIFVQNDEKQFNRRFRNKTDNVQLIKDNFMQFVIKVTTSLNYFLFECPNSILLSTLPSFKKKKGKRKT